MQEIEDRTLLNRPASLRGGLSVNAPGREPDEISIAEILRIFYRRKWMTIATTLIVLGLAVAYSFLWPATYQSTAVLEIDPNRTSQMGMEDLLTGGLFSDSDRMIASEVNVLQSDTVAALAIKEAKLVRTPGFLTPEETSSFPEEMERMTPVQRRRVLGALQSSLVVKTIPDTYLVTLTFRHRNPKFSADVLNALIRAYMERAFISRHEGAALVGNWLAGQMSDLQKENVAAQHKLADFQKLHGILGTDEDNNIVVDRLKQLNLQLTDAEMDRILKEAHYRLAATGDPELMVPVAPANLQTLRAQQADLRLQLGQLKSKYGAGYPRVGETEAQLRKLDGDIATEVDNVAKRMKAEFDSASRTEAMIRKQFEQQKSEAYKLNENAVEYAILRHEVESTTTLYDTLQLKLKGADVSSGLSASFVSVVDPADIPAFPVLPKKALTILIGLLGGLVLGCVLSFVVESVDDTLSSSEELELCTGLPVLCSIPFNHVQGRSKAEVADANPIPVAPMLVNFPHTHASEAFRGLRTSLLLSSPDRLPKVIAVVSSLAGEGKTTVATNLGVSFAQRGESVLLIDADLRRSAMHAQFGLPQSRYGTSTVLTQGMNDRAILTPLPSLPNLKLLAAGPHPPNPAELLGSKRMVEMLETFASQYDKIVIDTAPILAVSDSLAMVSIADAVVMIVRSELARKKAVLRVCSLLHRSNCNLVGLVFNAVNLQLEHYYYARGAQYDKSIGSYYRNEED